MRNKILTWALFAQKHEINKIWTWDIVVTFPYFLEGNFYPLCVWPSKIFLSLPLIKGHSMLCNTYTFRLTCTANLSRFSHVTIQVTLLLITTKIFNAILTVEFQKEFQKELQPSNNQANKVAAVLLLKAREKFRFTK